MATTQQVIGMTQDKLRSHLLECLRLKKMTPFPSQLHRPGRPQTEHIRVYCSCHLPDDGKEKMAACDRCAEWYHISCENIQKQYLRTLEPSGYAVNVFRKISFFLVCVCTCNCGLLPQLKHTKLKKKSSYDHYIVTQLARTIFSS